MTTSVIIPVHDRTEFIAHALLSVYGQKIPFDAVYVIANKDLNVEKEIDYCFRYDNFHIYKVKSNVSLSGKINLGMFASQTDNVMVLCDDDMLAPTYLSSCLWTMDMVEADIVYTDRELFGLDNRIVVSGDWNLEEFKKYNPIPFTSLMKKKVWETLKFRNIPFLDWDFWWRACKSGFIAQHFSEPLFRLRTHLGQYSRVVDVEASTKEVIDANS